MLSTEQQEKAIGGLLKRKENIYCADCNGKSPCWASLDFGVFICMNCSGAHRALGPSTTRVKSTKLDTWHRDWLEQMQLGNSQLNQYWEARLDGVARTSKPNVNTPLPEIIKFVHDKYVKRKYTDLDAPADPLSLHKQGLAPFRPKVAPKLQPPREQPQKQEVVKQEVVKQERGQVKREVFKRKAAQNLISFEEESKKGFNFSEFDFNQPVQSTKVQKHGKSQFRTVSGSTQGGFDFFNFKVEETKSTQNQSVSPVVHHHNNFLGTQASNHHQYSSISGHHSNTLSGNHFGNYGGNGYGYQYGQSVPSPLPVNDKNQSLNLNMGLYQKSNNLGVNSIYPPQAPVPKQLNQNISLHSDINFETLGRQKVQEASTSWVDDWK